MTDTALIVGVGSGLGAAVARRFAAAGMAVAVASRSAGSRDSVVAEISGSGGAARGYECDATDEDSVERLFLASLRQALEDIAPEQLETASRTSIAMVGSKLGGKGPSSSSSSQIPYFAEPSLVMDRSALTMARCSKD